MSHTSETLAQNFPKPAPDLAVAESWRHHELELNVIGRTTARPERLDETGEIIESGDDATIQPPLAEVKPDAWAMRVCPGGAGLAAGSVVVARSLEWPGAVAISSGNRFLNLYVGSGIRFSSEGYTPPFPLPISIEFVQGDEDALQLMEHADVKVDPTPPIEENEDDDAEGD